MKLWRVGTTPYLNWQASCGSAKWCKKRDLRELCWLRRR